MNIKILDSWLREYLQTKASVEKIAETLSLTSVSVEKIEKFGINDHVYDIEVTTNRPDLMSVMGLAREGAAALSESGIQATFKPPVIKKPLSPKQSLPITIKNDPKLVNRICAVVMEVSLKQSPQHIKKRLEASGIRSLNNLIDVTNCVMRELGHPTHVFDYDRLTTKELIIRESKKGEKIKTLDGKEHILQGGDIIADNGKGEIVDLLGVMGTANSVVTDQTKRILFFLDNNEQHHIRKTSMNLTIRSEAAVLNEKGVDPELAMEALLRGIELYEEIAEGKLLSKIIDIYPNKPKVKHLSVLMDKINKMIGVDIPTKTIIEILNKLGFEAKLNEKSITIIVPSWRNKDIDIEEDIIEEIARIYGYYKLPNVLPLLTQVENYHESSDPFYWERRVRDALKYWGFTEIYTYSLVSEALLEGPVEEALSVVNPLSQDLVYLRKTLVPSLLNIIYENSNREEIKIFELANIYLPQTNNLPKEVLTLAGVIKNEKVSFYEVKGIVEQLLSDLGIKKLNFKNKQSGGLGADVYIENDSLGEIELLTENVADFELNFEIILKHATLEKVYKPLPKYPPIIEDITALTNPKTNYGQIVSLIKKQSELIESVELLDVYKNKQTFRIKYRDLQKNLTTEDVAKIREKIIDVLKKELNAKLKE